MIEKQRKILRFYLSTDYNVHRKFYWFEINNNDLYWGSSSKTKEAFCTISDKAPDSFSIKPSIDFKDLKPGQSKYSFHESGQFHRKELKGNHYCIADLARNWPEKNSVFEPFRFFSLISKPFYDYPIETKKLTRDNGYGDSILLQKETAKNRIFFEFFLCRPGTYNNPEALIDFGVNYQKIIYRKMNDTYTIMARFTKLDNLHNWHPDKELIFIG